MKSPRSQSQTMESESIRKMKIPFFCFECIVLLKRRLDRIAIDKWTVVKLLVSLLQIYDNLNF